MKLIPTTLLTTSVAIFSSCQNQTNNTEAQSRHEEMKQIITSYDSKVAAKQSEMEKQIKDQQKTIAELQKLALKTHTDLQDLSNAKNSDYVNAALSLVDIPNTEIRRSVMTILGQLKGPAAEQGLIKIILTGNDSSTVSSGLSILQNMGSEKLREVCLKILKKGNIKEMQYALRQLTPIATKEDTKEVIKIAKNLSASSTEYNVRYCWQYIMKFFMEKGSEECVPLVLKAMKEFNREAFTNMCWAAIITNKYGNQEQYKAAEKSIKPFLNDPNLSMDSDISYWVRKNSRVELFPVINLLHSKAGNSYQRYFIEGFANMSHPKAAKKLVEEYKTTKNSSTKSYLQKSFQGGFPGIMWFEEKKEAKLIPEKELIELIKNFDK